MRRRLSKWEGPWGRWRAGPGVRYGSALIWLGFVVFPLVNAFANQGATVQHGLAIIGALVFVAAYIGLVFSARAQRRGRVVPALFLLLIAVAAALTLADRPSWAFLFIYCAACSAFVATPALGFAGVIVCTALAGSLSALGGASGGTAAGFVTSSLGIGLLMLLMRDLRVRNEELNSARAELARLAVAEERERFARDLHDLLGHTLSVIALKTELAGRLLPAEPERARREIGDVERVARKALGEVREAVSGYRKPTLDGELAGARMALEAAGIQADFDRPAVTLDPAVEAVLSWAVREGATNVIRHSNSSHCSVTITAGLSEAGVEIVDDGVGAGPDTATLIAEGSGLPGLSERVRALGGQLQAGNAQVRGFRLAVTVPIVGSKGASEAGQGPVGDDAAPAAGDAAPAAGDAAPAAGDAAPAVRGPTTQRLARP
jgi:two-component system, NarL family, sensor histidine kinase DesK